MCIRDRFNLAHASLWAIMKHTMTLLSINSATISTLLYDPPSISFFRRSHYSTFYFLSACFLQIRLRSQGPSFWLLVTTSLNWLLLNTNLDFTNLKLHSATSLLHIFSCTYFHVPSKPFSAFYYYWQKINYHWYFNNNNNINGSFLTA